MTFGYRHVIFVTYDKLHYWNSSTPKCSQRFSPAGKVLGEAAGVTDNIKPVCATICAGVGKRMHTLPSHPSSGEPRGFGWGALTSRTLHLLWPAAPIQHLTAFPSCEISFGKRFINPSTATTEAGQKVGHRLNPSSAITSYGVIGKSKIMLYYPKKEICFETYHQCNM